MVLEKTLESPLDREEIKPISHKANEPLILTGRTDTEALKLRPSDVNNQPIGKDPEAGKN